MALKSWPQSTNLSNFDKRWSDADLIWCSFCVFLILLHLFFQKNNPKNWRNRPPILEKLSGMYLVSKIDVLINFRDSWAEDRDFTMDVPGGFSDLNNYNSNWKKKLGNFFLNIFFLNFTIRWKLYYARTVFLKFEHTKTFVLLKHQKKFFWPMLCLYANLSIHHGVLQRRESNC